MKKMLTVVCLLFCACREEHRSFFCLENGKCVTLWRTHNEVCYVIPGKYSGVSKPSSVSYIKTTFSKGMDIIWQKDNESIIVNLEDEKEQFIHESPTGIKIMNYNSNKKHNDSLFLYFDGIYHRYKKNVDFMTINVLEDYAYGQNGKRLE